MQTSLPSAALGKEFFVECRALGKELICRVLDSRHRLPRVTVFGHVLLYRVLAVRHSAKIFFLKYFAECPWHGARQRFNIFFLKCLCRVPNSFGTRQREELKKLYFILKYLCRVPQWKHSPKRKFLKNIQKTSLPSVLFLALGKDPLCRVPCPGARQSFFLFLASKFFVQPF